MTPLTFGRKPSGVPTRVLTLCGLLFALTCPAQAQRQTPPPGHPSYKSSGWWAPMVDWAIPGGNLSVHAALLRGDSTHSQVLTWALDPNVYAWRYNPLDTITNPIDPSQWSHTAARDNIFCAGLNFLSDGRLLVTGGYLGDDVGVKYANLYTGSGSLSGRWQSAGSMSVGRWYPTNTTLSTGKVLVNAGTMGFPFYVFGGLTGSGVTSTCHPFIDGADLGWSSNVNTATNVLGRISARTNAAAVYAKTVDGQDGKTFIFGGDSSGVLFNDTHVVSYDYNIDYDGRYDVGTVVIDSGGLPTPREMTGAVWAAALNGDGSTMWIFGGKDSAGGAFNDMWKLTITNASINHGYWTKVTGATGVPAARWGQTMFYDPGPCDPFVGAGDTARIVLFGGTNGSSVFGELYEYNVATNAWTLDTTSAAFQRYGACLAQAHHDCNQGQDKEHERAFAFGGKDSAGVVHKEAFLLWRNESSPSSPTLNLPWHVKQLNPSVQGPGPRTQASMAFDEHFNRMMVFGGDTTGVGGTYSGDTWALSTIVADSAGSGGGPWKLLSPAGSIAARAGHVMVIAGFADEARDDEVFDPAGSPTDSSWTPLSNASKFQSAYPQVFQLPSGNVLNVGGRDSTWRLSDSSGTYLWKNKPSGPYPLYTGFESGSAAMPLGGKILRAGGSQGSTKKDSLAWLEFHGLTLEDTAAWRKTTPTNMQNRRTQLNIVLLPDSSAMIMGGTGSSGEDCGAFDVVKTPELWMPPRGASNPGWHLLRPIPFLPDPACRIYHSCALLLPDGRILSVGGPDLKAGSDAHKGTIFWPPYLFDSGGALAVRPVISAAQDTVAAGDSLKIIVSGTTALSSIALMRPGAVTHAFNESQLFIPLGFTQNVDICQNSVIRARLPYQGYRGIASHTDTLAYPPGDYLLFCIGTNGTPSVARWVRLGKTTSTAPSDCGYGSDGGDGGCPFVDTHVAGGWAVENSILNRSLTGEMENDGYRLLATPDINGGVLRLRVRENEQESTKLDQIGLVAVDHAAGTKAYLVNGRAVIGARSEVVQVTKSTGEDLTSLFTSGGVGLVGKPGDTLIVNLGMGLSRAHGTPNGKGTAATQYIQGGGGGVGLDGEYKGKPRIAGNATPQSVDSDLLNSSGILVQAPDGQGDWRTVVHFYPREKSDETVIDSLDHGLIRLIFVGRHTLGSIARIAYDETTPTTQVLQPTVARHSRLGDVRSAVAASDTTNVSLATGDTLNLSFQVGSVPDSQVRDYFVVAHGVYTASLPNQAQRGVQSGVPLQFALRQNRPNPFGRSTNIQFDLPRATGVKLGVFDIQGRMIRQLVNAQYQPGSWTATWDRRTQAGSLAPAGVYFYRLDAGSYRDQKKMMILQ